MSVENPNYQIRYPFRGKVCLITGAASGIGAATALLIAQKGGDVVIGDIDMAGLARTSRACLEEEIGCYDGRLDVSDSQAVDDFVEEYSRQAAGFDFVFNCAGVNPTAYALTDTTDSYFSKLMDTNVRGTYNVTRACIPRLREGGSIVNVSSIMGVTASANYAIYCATKWAIVGFTKAMALELGPMGFRCNAVAPGYIDTPTNAGVLEGPEAVREAESRIAMGRMGTSEEVAEVVAFLFSDEARYINGSIVEVNGGR